MRPEKSRKSVPFYRPGSARRVQGTLVALALALAASVAAAADDLARALELYDEGRYAEALPLLDLAVASGTTTGPVLYRLYYCQLVTGNEGARATLMQARETLEDEYESAGSLENAFYLANVYRNIGRNSQASEIAAGATARIESGDWTEPTSTAGRFQLGKLYADQGNVERATGWFERILGDDDGPLSPQARWAARYLSQQAAEAGDVDRSLLYLEKVSDAPEVTPAELDRLAVAQARAGRYRAARDSWHRALIKNPATGDRARYCSNLAYQASQLTPLPTATADGTPIAELGRGGLEALMAEQAAAASQIIQETAALPEAPSEERWNELTAELQAMRAVFVAAAMEYVVNEWPIRETSFQGGYAPMIFHSRRWELTPAEE